MEAATLTPPAIRLSSFMESARGTPNSARDREPRTCAERPSSCTTETSVALRYRRSERTALYIETQEGDVVRLKIKARTALHASSSSSANETEVAEVSVSARNFIKIRFSVDGNLNAEELAAIRSVVEQASGLAAEFFAGGAPEAFAAAAGLEIDGAQLARVGLRLSVREHLTYSASGTYRPAAPMPPPSPPPSPPPARLPEPPAAPPVASNGAQTTPLATAEPAAAALATPEPAAATPPPVAESPTMPVPSANAASAALATISQFLSQLLDSLAQPLPAEDHGTALSIELSLKLRVFQSVALTLAATQLPNSDAAQSGVPLLADTLDALAAHEQPVDTTA
jgi:hypothetical protein